jgi:protein-histidine pros-kinase
VFSAQRAVDAALKLEELAAAGDARALTSQAGVAGREMELLGEVLREEVARGG